MPISEDEYEQHHERPNQSTLSKVEQRRNNKPIMEKRRRARINHCLNELKTLILDAMKKDSARHSKLEKADILEMTVKHLQSLQRQQLAVGLATDPVILNKFKTGFNECAGEVSRYIGNMDGVETGVKQRLSAHLSNCVSDLQPPPVNSFTIPGVPGNSNTIPVTITQGNTIHGSSGFNGDVNNNKNRIQVPPGIQLIPSRLPSGELALLVPNSNDIPFFNSTLLGNSSFGLSTEPLLTQRTSNSAFTTVKSTKTTDLKISSPPLSPASSTTSFEDHVTESFQRPRTPSPKEVKVSFLTPPDQVYHSSAFKPRQEPKPAQQFQVTSTSYSPENKTQLNLGLKIEYKAVPIYKPTEKPNTVINRQFGGNSLEPLSVITTKTPTKEKYQNNTPEMYYRKRPANDGLLALTSASKYPRYSADDVSISTTSNSSASLDHQFSVDHFYQQPSTSGRNSNESHHSDTNNEQNEHMWRPW